MKCFGSAAVNLFTIFSHSLLYDHLNVLVAPEDLFLVTLPLFKTSSIPSLNTVSSQLDGNNDPDSNKPLFSFSNGKIHFPFSMHCQLRFSLEKGLVHTVLLSVFLLIKQNTQVLSTMAAEPLAVLPIRSQMTQHVDLAEPQ